MPGQMLGCGSGASLLAVISCQCSSADGEEARDGVRRESCTFGVWEVLVLWEIWAFSVSW